MSPPDRTLTSRFELKYWLHPQLVPLVRQGLGPFMRPDQHAAKREGYRYTICSLYLDSPTLDLYRTTIEGHRNRFKLRIRSYTDAPDTPVFFEIKKRADKVIRKRRAPVSREVAQAFLRGELAAVNPTIPEFEEFAQAAARLGAKPIVRVRYEREAYESCGADPLRITFDTALVHAVTPGPVLSLDGPGWVASPTQGVILEVKFTDVCPAWVTSLVRSLELDRCSVPKYILSVDRAREMHGPDLFVTSAAGRSGC